MKEQRYNISFHTPIGMKQGVMFVMFEENHIKGKMELLQQQVPFSGNIKENGDCQIRGYIKSLMRTIEYIATGKITKNKVFLNLKGGKHTFTISGIASLEKGGKNI